MKTELLFKLLRTLIRMSRYFLLIVLIQTLAASMLLADESRAQGQSIYEIKLSLDLNNVGLIQAFEEIEDQTGFTFSYYSEVVKGEERLTLKGNTTLGETLEQISQQTNLKFRRIDNNIHASRKTNGDRSVVEASAKLGQALNVQGKVLDENGQGLPGATVMEKGSNNGTVSDMSGNFSLGVSSSQALLLVSFVGYEPKEVAVNGQSELNISLDPDYTSLEEVVVIGYGSVKKSDLTGSVASIKQEDIVAIPTNNVLESMQGKVSGVDLVRESGKVGSPIKMTVRGNRSLTANNSPLILVDGIAFGSDVNINPNDVESIEVLKDASATAIYGSRGANGVIMITTKKGKAGAAKVNINMYKGVNDLTRYPKLNNLEQYVAQRREAFRATGEWSSPADDENIFAPAEYELIQQGNDTDWYDVIYDQGKVQDYQVSVTGGNERTQLALSLDYYNEEGILKNDNLDRYSGRMNINQKVNDKLSVGGSVFFNYSHANQRRDAIFDQVQKMPPFGVPYEEDGSINRYPFNNTDVNPLVDGYDENYLNEVNSYQTFLASNLEYRIVEGLVFRSSLGVNVTNYKNGIYEGLGSTAVQSNQGLSKASKEDRTSRGITWENTLTYDKTIGDHAVTFLLGNTVLSNYQETTMATGYDLGYEQAQYHNLGSAAGDRLVSSSLSESSLLSYFGRLNYRLKDRYLVTFTLRSDGSSVLNEDNRWAYFPSGAIAWRLSEEAFMSSINVISDMKLRASLGVSGNSSVSPYQSQGVLSQTVYSFEETPAYGYRPGTISNSELKWERTKSFDVGLDFGFFEDRIKGTVDFYRTWTSDLLMNRLIPSHTGYDNVLANVGATETQGIDLTLSTYNVQTNNFTWSTDFTFSKNKEEITKLNEGQDDVGNSWFIGSPINVFYDYEKIGIWQLGEESEAAEYGQAPGDIKVRDMNDDGIISAEDDRIIVGQATPKWTAGINNTLSYKGIDLAVFMIARVGQTINSQASGHFRPDARENSADVDYWTPENPTNDYPRPNANRTISSMLYATTLAYGDGSFLKIRTITLGYSLPSSWTDRVGISNVRIYGTAKNYFTFSHYDNYDPERGGSSSYPMTKQLVFGANISF